MLGWMLLGAVVGLLALAVLGAGLVVVAARTRVRATRWAQPVAVPRLFAVPDPVPSYAVARRSPTRSPAPRLRTVPSDDR